MATIKVHKFGNAFGMPDSSPFVVKVETYLRMTDQPYEAVTGDIRKAPRKQLPIVTIDGEIVPDSTAIVERLEGARPEKLDAHLDDRQRAVGQAVKSMLEEHLYFSILYMRWVTDEGWAIFEPSLRELLGTMGVPGMLKGVVAGQARKQTVNRTQVQGVGRQPRSEIVAASKKILDSFSTLLGAGPFFFGDRPTTYDATAYAFAVGALCPAFDNEVRKHAASKENLVGYEARLKDKYWKS
ncbi:MAG TPA: glutathione S-transferase family protein [Polyangiaceae bacterium]